MDEYAELMIKIQLGILKGQMKNDGLIFGFAVDKEDINNSKLCFINKEEYLNNGKTDGLMISLSDLNNGLL